MSAQARISHTTVGPLAGKFKEKVSKGITRAAKKWNLQLDENLDLSEHKFEGEGTTRLGNRPIEKNTAGNYEQMYRQLWRFLAMKGDYDSMLLLLSPPPVGVPAMNVHSVEEFLRFKRFQKDTKLRTYDDRKNVKDVLKKDMVCSGGWVAPKNADIYRAAINDIHVANNHVGEYLEACDMCRKLPESHQHKGCDHHKGNPQLRRKGNPTKHSIFTNSIVQRKKDSVEYEEQGSSQLLPSDVRLLRTHLLSTKCIVNLQMWVIIIVSIKLFLRHDEFHDIEMAHFLPELFHILEDRIESLVLKVFGKSDKRWIKLALFSDNEYPDLCPIRPLLVYMHLIGIKDGYLFPSEAELLDPPSDGVYKTFINYATFMSHLQTICDKVLPAREDLKIGCQTFRKTGYLFGVFGNAFGPDLSQSARHSSKSESTKYRKDAAELFQTHLRAPNPVNNVSDWFCIRVEGGGGNARLMSAYGGSKRVETAQLGSFFVVELLGITSTHAFAKDPVFLVRTALGYVGKENSTRQRYEELLNSLPTEIAHSLRSVVDNMLLERLRGILQNNQVATLVAALPAAASPASTTVPVSTSEAVSQSKKKRCLKSSKNDLEERHHIKDASNTEQKITKMKEMYDVRGNWDKPLSPGAKSFVTKHLVPAMRCLEVHFHWNITAFCEKYPDFNHTTFPTKCCNGKQSTCSPK